MDFFSFHLNLDSGKKFGRCARLVLSSIERASRGCSVEYWDESRRIHLLLLCAKVQRRRRLQCTGNSQNSMQTERHALLHPQFCHDLQIHYFSRAASVHRQNSHQWNQLASSSQMESSFTCKHISF